MVNGQAVVKGKPTTINCQTLLDGDHDIRLPFWQNARREALKNARSREA